MTMTPLPLLIPSERTLQWLGASDLLGISAPPSTGELAELGPLASLVEGALAGSDPAQGDVGLPQALTAPANGLVLGTHAGIEETAHGVAALNAPLHGVTNLGETVGLGHLGEPGNLVTDAVTPDGAGASPLLADAGAVAGAAALLAGSAAGAAGPGLAGDGGALAPAADILDQGVLALHATLEETSHGSAAPNGPVHGLTGLGEAVGLGYLGTSGNLATSLIDLPGTALSGGGFAGAAAILDGLADVTRAGGTLVGNLTGAATAGGGLLAADGPLAPVSNLANGAVLGLHAGLEQAAHGAPALNGAIHAVTGLGETVGLGYLGTPGNLATDVVNLPGELLGGLGGGVGGLGQGVAALSQVLADAGQVTDQAVGTVGPLAGSVGGLLGSGGLLQAVAPAANGLVDGLHDGLEQAAHGVPALNEAVHAVTGLGEAVGPGAVGEGSNPVTALANLPGAVLAGQAGPALGQLAGGLGPVAAVTGALGEAGTVPGATPDGLLAPVAALLGGVAGGGAGAHPLVEVGAGPETASPLANLGLLSPATEGGQSVQVDALSAPAGQPALLDLTLLAGDGIEFPKAAGGGDALVGKLLDVATALPGAAEPGHGLHPDLGGLLDLGDHAGTQTAETHPTDPTPHGAAPAGHVLCL